MGLLQRETRILLQRETRILLQRETRILLQRKTRILLQRKTRILLQPKTRFLLLNIIAYCLYLPVFCEYNFSVDSSLLESNLIYLYFYISFSISSTCRPEV